MENEKIKLSQLLELCVKFKQDPSDNATYQEIQKLRSQFQIKQYLPLLQKEIAVICIVAAIREGEDAIDAAIKINLAKILYGLFRYIDNLDIDILYAYITPAMIDCLYELEIIDEVEQYCGKDFKRLEDILESALNFTNMERISMMSGPVLSGEVDELISTLKELKSDLSPETIEKLRELSVENSDEMSVIRDTLGSILHENVIKENLREAETEQ